MTERGKYQKKPVVVEAWQFDGTVECAAAMEIEYGSNVGHNCDEDGEFDGRMCCYTLEGKMLADAGDWIITGVKGERYPCKPDIFEMTYDFTGETIPLTVITPDDDEDDA